MVGFKVIRDALPQASEIVALAEQYTDLFHRYRDKKGTGELFDPYRPTTYEKDDDYQGLTLNLMPPALANLISSALHLGGVNQPHFVRLQRYEAGDFVLPHRDFENQSLFILTSSDLDGLCVQGPDGTFRTIPDRAGTYIEMDFRHWHWVDPVCEGPRYSLATIPRLKKLPHEFEGYEKVTRAQIGQGETGAIFEGAMSGTVVKKCKRTRGYDLFLDVVAKTKSPHLPIIYEISRQPNGYQVIEMEKLSPLDDSHHEQMRLYDGFARLCHSIADGRMVFEPISLPGPLERLARDIGQYARRCNVPLDLDRANAMVRPGSGELVIIDPYW